MREGSEVERMTGSEGRGKAVLMGNRPNKDQYRTLTYNKQNDDDGDDDDDYNEYRVAQKVSHYQIIKNRIKSD